MKKILIVVITLIFTYGCNHVESDTIKIGVILPLTGSRANAGSDGKKGVELVLTQIKEENPTFYNKLKVIIEDNNSLATSTINAYQKLINQNHVDIIFGPLASNTSLALVPLVNKDGIILVLPTSSSSKLSNAGPTIFRSGLLAEDQAKAAADYIISKEYKKAAIFYMNDETGEGYKKSFYDTFIANGGQISSVESYSVDKVDFRTNLVKISASEPEIIFIPSTPKLLGIIINQIKELGLNVPVISNFGIEGNELIDIAKDNANGIVYTSILLDDEIAMRSEKQYDTQMGVVTALCYDGFKIITDAIQEIESQNINDITKILVSKRFKGATGNIYFNNLHDAVREMTIKSVVNGKFVVVGN